MRNPSRPVRFALSGLILLAVQVTPAQSLPAVEWREMLVPANGHSLVDLESGRVETARADQAMRFKIDKLADLIVVSREGSPPTIFLRDFQGSPAGEANSEKLNKLLAQGIPADAELPSPAVSLTVLAPEFPQTWLGVTHDGQLGVLRIEQSDRGLRVLWHEPKRSERDSGQRPGMDHYEAIAQRDDAELRSQTLEKLGEMIAGGGPPAAEALKTLARVADVPFDRTPFLPLVRQSLESPNAQARARALGVIGMMGGDASDIPAVVALAFDEEPAVRSAVARALFALDPKGEHQAITPTLDLLLHDPKADVIKSTLQSFWGHPLDAAIEKRVIELSRERQHFDTAVYYALSTRPMVSRPVAERLVEVLEDVHVDHNNRGRAAWGLAHPPEEAAKDVVRAAAIRALAQSTDRYIRQNAIQALALTGGDDAIVALQAIVADDAENMSVRDDARNALRRLGQ